MNLFKLFEKVAMVHKLYVFDFDKTLCNTPEKPAGFRGDWWGSKESLMSPYVKKGVDICNQSVVDEYLKAKNMSNSYVVMMTGRVEELKPLALDILKQHHVDLDGSNERSIFCDGGNTLRYKVANLKKLVEEFADIKTLDIWEDRNTYLDAFDKFKEKLKEEKPELKVTIHRPPWK